MEAKNRYWVYSSAGHFICTAWLDDNMATQYRARGYELQPADREDDH